MKKSCYVLLATAASILTYGAANGALDYQPTQIAQLQGLDKITARISTFDVPVGQVADFGTLSIKVDACYRTPPEETPENAGFLEITDTHDDGTPGKQLFSGWMFSSSPGLSALKHPVYDVWVKECLNPDDKKDDSPQQSEGPDDNEAP